MGLRGGGAGPPLVTYGGGPTLSLTSMEKLHFPFRAIIFPSRRWGTRTYVCHLSAFLSYTYFTSTLEEDLVEEGDIELESLPLQVLLALALANCDAKEVLRVHVSTACN